MHAIIISIGNELLNGKTVNSNASFIAGKLYDIGIVTRQALTVRDEAESIKECLQTALNKADIIVITGGLGPTHDDITQNVVADFFQSDLVFNEPILQKLKERFQRRGLQMPEINRKQAWVPEKAHIIDNPVGTAAGLHFEEPAAVSEKYPGKHVFVLPGVPREMEAMMEAYAIPFLREKNTAGLIAIHQYRTTGVPESKLYELCRSLFESHSSYEIAFLPKLSRVDIRIAVKQDGSADAKKFPAFETALYRIIGEYIYAKGNEELEEVLGRLLRERGLSLAVAESCTGGLIQSRITDIAGSSDYFMGGMVTYSNESKIQHLNVRREFLEKFGAVSEAVAKEMAEGARRSFGTDMALSTTGIAGPGGATPEKPLGLVYIGLATTGGVKASKFLLSGDRQVIKERGAQFALELLRRELLGIK